MKKQLDEGAIIQGARREAALIWDSFINALKKLAFEGKMNAYDLPRHLNDLAARIQKEIKNERVRQATMDLIDLKIADTAKYLGEFKLVMENTVNVIAHCPHLDEYESKDDPGSKDGQECDWTGRIRVDKVEFNVGDVQFECPDCGGTLFAAHMTLLEEST